MHADVQAAPNKSIILLHACAHNPTGVDPTEAQWREISQLVKEKQHFPFFDMVRVLHSRVFCAELMVPVCPWFRRPIRALPPATSTRTHLLCGTSLRRVTRWCSASRLPRCDCSPMRYMRALQDVDANLPARTWACTASVSVHSPS